MAASGKTKLDGEDGARWQCWVRWSHRGGGPRRGAGVGDEGSTEEGGGAKIGMGGVIAGHGKERDALHPHPCMLLEAAHRSCPASVGLAADGSSMFAFTREWC
jgi:hypothetical protein